MTGDVRQLPSGLFVVDPPPPPPEPEPPAPSRRCRSCGRPEPGEPHPVFRHAPAGWWDHWFTCRHERPVTCPECSAGFPADYRGCSACGCEEEYT